MNALQIQKVGTPNNKEWNTIKGHRRSGIARRENRADETDDCGFQSDDLFKFHFFGCLVVFISQYE